MSGDDGRCPDGELLSEIAGGLAYTYERLNENTAKSLESTSFLYALIEILSDKGIISIDELDRRKKRIAEGLVRRFVESGIGLLYQDPEYDKYTFEHEARSDCLDLLPVCKAVCCKVPFALSRQDVEEGIVRWTFARPYVIAHGEDGYCVHLDRETYKCMVRENRPVPCRGFDCKDGGKWRVWRDYEGKALDPGLEERIGSACSQFFRINTK